MNTFFKRFLSVAMAFGTLVSSCCMSARAAGTPQLEAELDKPSLSQSASPQSVELTVSASEAMDICAFEFTVRLPEGFSVASIESGDKNVTDSELVLFSSPRNGYVAWIAGGLTGNQDDRSVKTLAVVEIDVPAGADAGEYEITVDSAIAAGNFGDNKIWEPGDTDITDTVTLTISEEDDISVDVEKNSDGTYTKTVTDADGNTTVTTYTPDEDGNPDLNEPVTVETIVDGKVVSTKETVPNGDGTFTVTVTDANGEKTVTKIGSSEQDLIDIIGGDDDPTPVNPKPTEETFLISATAGVNGSIAPLRVNVKKNGNQTFRITPKSGYEVADVKVDGKSVGAVSTYTFSNVTATHTINATFQKATGNTGGSTGGGSTAPVTTKTYQIVATAGTNGTITPAFANVNQGASQTFRITPKDGYEISDVRVDSRSVGAVSSYTFKNVTANHAITAVFKAKTSGSVTGGTATKTPTTTTPNTTTPAAESSTGFNDVQAKAWYKDAVEYVTKKGLMNGVGDKKFSPDGTLTRGMLVTILWRLDGSPTVSGKTFSDVSSKQWYASGYGNGKFGPDDLITREQFAAIVYRYAGMKKYDVSKTVKLNSFTDSAKVSSWASDALSWANAAGLITGTSAGTLDPKGNATRAQAAAILMRFCENVAK